MNNIIKFRVGCDRRSRNYEDCDIKSNLLKYKIEQAYDVGTNIIGFNLITDVAYDYDDTEISEDKYQTLIKAGFSNKDLELKYNITNTGRIPYIDTFLEMYLFIAKLGNSKFEYEILNHPIISINGEGLFCE